MKNRQLKAKGRPIAEPHFDPFFDFMRPTQDSSEGLPYGLARMILNAMKETGLLEAFERYDLVGGSYGKAVAMALVAARLEHPANLSETISWINESSGLPLLLGLNEDQSWTGMVDLLLDYLTFKKEALFNKLYLTDMDRTNYANTLVFTFDPTQNFLDQMEIPEGSSKGRTPFMIFDRNGYLLETEMIYEKPYSDITYSLSTCEELELILDQRDQNKAEDNGLIFIIGPWDTEPLTELIKSREFQYVVLERVPLPRSGTYAPPYPGRLIHHQPKDKEPIFIWGCPGYGPIFDDLLLDPKTAAKEHPDLMISKGMVAFRIADLNIEDESVININKLVADALKINSCFRHFAVPEYPLGLANVQDNHNHREFHYNTLGLMAYQCFTYIRKMFVGHNLPFNWQMLKRFLNTQLITDVWKDEEPLRYRFGDPDKRAYNFFKFFDMLDKPIVLPKLVNREMKDIELILSEDENLNMEFFDGHWDPNNADRANAHLKDIAVEEKYTLIIDSEIVKQTPVKAKPPKSLADPKGSTPKAQADKTPAQKAQADKKPAPKAQADKTPSPKAQADKTPAPKAQADKKPTKVTVKETTKGTKVLVKDAASKAIQAAKEERAKKSVKPGSPKTKPKK
ncbi:MAG: hypothetical protein LBS44_00415 [Deltaproteobacteria bacterium]|nr:hypothetical protein [Deltaproteobacteria bacterium]